MFLSEKWQNEEKVKAKDSIPEATSRTPLCDEALAAAAVLDPGVTIEKVRIEAFKQESGWS